jgi:hypothetical protein
MGLKMVILIGEVVSDMVSGDASDPWESLTREKYPEG